MTFNSLHFLLFLATVTPLFYLVSERHRLWLLLAASYYFYMAGGPANGLLILSCTVLNFYCAAALRRENASISRRRALLVTAVCGSLALLFAFKYLGFLNETGRTVSTLFGFHWPIPPVHVPLPISISFFTFQTLSYTIDVYRGHFDPERNIGRFGLFISFYPQLVAGPIERPSRLLPQLPGRARFEPDNITRGLERMLWGFFKKVVIADQLALFVNQVYQQPERYTGAPLLVATVLFGFQIFCDFSGYSDIAIGAARMLGIDLMDNFSAPFAATSVTDFWRRWHISLSTWFRDYVYIPLGGNRAGFSRELLNLFAVFLISGLWHGARWTFVAWGALHGLSVVFERIFARLGLRPPKLFPRWATVVVGCSLTYVFVTMAWVFFRANSFHDAFYILTHLFTDFGQSLQGDYIAGLGRSDAKTAFYALFVLLLPFARERMATIAASWKRVATPLRWVAAQGLVYWILFWGATNSESTFVYFQF